MQMQIVVDSSKSSSVMPSVHMHNFESISVTEVIIDLLKPCQLFTCVDQNWVRMHVLGMHTLTQLLVALKNCFTFIPPFHWQMDKSKHFSAFIKGGWN